jgi:sulfite reductase beta subunit-like hemoprotein
MQATQGGLRVALDAHAERVDAYRQGKLTADEFGRARLTYGLYYVLDHTSYLQRIKLPGGALTAAQAHEIADMADEYARGRMHVTTRQNLQLHWVDLSKVMEVYARLQRVGMTTRGAAGDSVRNITGCSHAGIWPGEVFDVMPYVSATDKHFLFHPLNFNLPHKFKVAFSSCPNDCAHARINDIGFFARRREGRNGFSVYVAGGLGAQPFVARPLREFVPAEDTLIIVEAVLRVWNRSGQRANRKKARLKYLFQRLGAERFVKAVDEEYAAIDAERGTALRGELTDALGAFSFSRPRHPASSLPHNGQSDFARWLGTNVSQQKQQGYYAATIVLPMGEITGSQLRGVATLAGEFGSGELRVTTDQNLILPWISGAYVQEVYRRLCAVNLGDAGALAVTDVVCCPGADYCSLAVSRSIGVAAAIRTHLLAREAHAADLGVLRIRVSGCPNACGQHHGADIGLAGLSLNGPDGRARPHYLMLLGGRLGESTTAIGKRMSGRFREEEIPTAVAALVEYYSRERRSNECFGEFVRRIGVARLTEVARSGASDAPLAVTPKACGAPDNRKRRGRSDQ